MGYATMAIYSEQGSITLVNGAGDVDGDPVTVRRINGTVVSSWPYIVALSTGQARIYETGLVEFDDGGATTGHPGAGQTAAAGSFSFTLWDGIDESPAYTADIDLLGVSQSSSGYNYGALTRAGAGGIALPPGASSISNAGGTNLTVAGGYVVAAGNGVSAGTVTFNNSATWDVTTTANAYSARTGGEIDTVIGLGTGTVSGKTILIRNGTYTYKSSWANNNFSSLTTFKAHGVLDDVTMTVASNMTVTAQNVQFEAIDFDLSVSTSINGEYNKGFLFKGGSDNVRWHGCRIRSNYKELMQALGVPYKLTAWTFRGMIAGQSGSWIGSGGLHVTDCKIHGAWRLINLTIDGGPVIMEGNEFYDFGVDAVVWSGKRESGHPIRSSFSWNEVHSPLNAWMPELTVLSVDTANNRLNVADTSPMGPPGTGFTLNFSSGNPPNGYSLFQDLGGASVLNGTQIQMAQNLSSAGSGTLKFKREQDHGDMFQVVAKGSNGITNEDQYNIDVVGNRMCGLRFDTFEASNGITLDTEMQGMFLQDINNVRQDNTTLFRNMLIAGNLIYTRDTSWGLGPHNATNGTIEHNTVVCPSGFSKKPTIRLDTHWNGGGSGNIMRGNMAKQITMIAPNTGTLSNNRAIDPDNGVEAVDYSALFVNPGVPTSIADLTARFAIKPGSPPDVVLPKQGTSPHVDYASRTYTPPI